MSTTVVHFTVQLPLRVDGVGWWGNCCSMGEAEDGASALEEMHALLKEEFDASNETHVGYLRAYAVACTHAVGVYLTDGKNMEWRACAW